MVLVTSRDSLAGLVAVDGAQRLDLDLLPPDDAVTLLGRLIGDRVEADPAAAAALAAQCAHLRLALRVAAELAATRPTTPLSELVAELADQQHRLDLLAADGDYRSAVAAVFSWSMRHLPAETARTFRLLGLHPGPDVDAYAVAALTDTDVPHARHALNRLARAHLVHPTEPGRYGMHDLLHAYAAGLTAEKDAETDPPCGVDPAVRLLCTAASDPRARRTCAPTSLTSTISRASSRVAFDRPSFGPSDILIACAKPSPTKRSS